jgi:Tfp pilus assembly protein PilF
MAMQTKLYIMIIAVLAMATLSGCLDSARKESAQSRWQRTMDKARLQAAHESVEQGNLAYAQKVLEDCVESNSSVSADAQVMLAQIQNDRQQYAKNQQEDTENEQAY